jgi:hypothetical protein
MNDTIQKVLELIHSPNIKIGVAMLVHLTDDDLYIVMKELSLRNDLREMLRDSFYEMKDERHWIQQKNFPVSCAWVEKRNLFVEAYAQGVLIRKKHPCFPTSRLNQKLINLIGELGVIEYDNEGE